jgi:hypothetical protein
MRIAVFWDVAHCSLVEIYWCFRSDYCLHRQGDDVGGSKGVWNVRSTATKLHGATSQKTDSFIFVDFKSSNVTKHTCVMFNKRIDLRMFVIARLQVCYHSINSVVGAPNAKHRYREGTGHGLQPLSYTSHLTFLILSSSKLCVQSLSPPH